MTRILALVSSAALLAGAVHAQCPQGADAGLVNWDAFDGYASTYGNFDEGITSPPIDLVPIFGAGGFPMAGAVGVLDQLWVNSNGEVYLTDSTLALTEPVNPASFGVSSLSELRGTLAGASARIACIGADHEASVVAGSSWSVTVDTSVPGEIRVTWHDMARFANTTDQFSATMRLLSSGAVEMSYGTLPNASRYVGVSIGNMVGTSSTPSSDLSATPTSGTLGLLFQSFTSSTWDLNLQTLTIVPNGTGGYDALPLVPYVAPACASNVVYGFGCHTYQGPDTENFLELFPDSPAAKAALDGNALSFTLTANGYVANWIVGGASAYVAPVSPTLTGLGDDSTVTITPSAAAPIPGGVTADWTISSNGVITAGAVGNQGTDFSPSLSETGTAAGLAWYTWRDWNPNEAGSGPVVWEEAGGVLYITWNGVEAYGSPSPNPGTWQMQVDLTTGNVLMVWVSFETSTSTSDVIVGCTLAGTNPTPASATLTSTPAILAPSVELVPMALSAAPAPVISPSTVVTFTASNLVEFQPNSGVYVSTAFLSVNPNPGGFDLQGILTTVPGCNAWIATLDLDLGGQVTFSNQASWNFAFSAPAFAPGNAVACQAICLFDPAFPLPNGEAGGFLVSNGVLSTTELQ